jgi:uncharacterized phage protein (TIGR01671 family)
MREIKFRAWNKELKQMNQVKGLHFVAHQDGRLDFIDAGWKWMPEAFELMQFTGLHDKNGKEIYEGDIVKFDTTDLKTKKLRHKFINQVRYDYCRFVVTDTSNDVPYCIYDVRQHIEVIGNIYENPELLEKQKELETPSCGAEIDNDGYGG